MRQRLISAAVLVPVVVIVFYLGRAWTSAGIAVVAALAAWETAELVRAAGLPANKWLVVAAPVIAIAGFGLEKEVFLYGFLPSGLAIALMACWMVITAFDGIRRADPREALLSWSGTLLAGLYVSLLACAVGILTLHIGDSSGRGQFWLLVLVLTVWALDSAAYVAGRYLPSGRFMNHISPNKTWSGAIGGTVAAVLVCTALAAVGDVNPLVGVLLGAVIAVAAQAGDLAESMIKRAAGAKDSGTLIPGHGGFLDRVDSFILATPVMYATLLVLSLARVNIQ